MVYSFFLLALSCGHGEYIFLINDVVIMLLSSMFSKINDILSQSFFMTNYVSIYFLFRVTPPSLKEKTKQIICSGLDKCGRRVTTCDQVFLPGDYVIKMWPFLGGGGTNIDQRNEHKRHIHFSLSPQY